MQQEQILIREQQKQSWNQFSGGWKKWEEELHAHMQLASAGIIHALQPNGNQVILDIASGTGEPGLEIATMLEDGRVILTDLANEMLDIARNNAAERKITNIECIACDVCALPFSDHYFDSISCRMGFMFFPDMQLAAREILRVLKPGGTFATTFWDVPAKNVWVTAIRDTINQHLQLPAPIPGAPGIFRCSEPGLMKQILTQAGFNTVTERAIPCNLHCSSADNYWQMMTQVAAPVVAALQHANEKVVAKIKEDVTVLLQQKYNNGDIVLEGNAILITGVK